jgi:hypothetical protein
VWNPLVTAGVQPPEEADQGQHLVRSKVRTEHTRVRAGAEDRADRGDDPVVLFVVEFGPGRGVEHIRQGVLLAAEDGEIVVRPTAQS